MLHRPVWVLSCLLLGTLGLSSPLLAAPQWRTGGPGIGHYTVSSADDSVTLTPKAPGASGLVETALCQSLKDTGPQRVRLSAEVETRPPGEASLWIRALQPGKTVLDSGLSAPVIGSSPGRVDSISLPLPGNASRVCAGFRISGGGLLRATHVRLIFEPLPTQAKPSAEAQAILDQAISLVRTHAYRRSAVDWTATLQRVDAMAAGAQTSDDVYPAMNLLLQSLGDHHSHVLRPDWFGTLSSGKVSNETPTIRAEPDRIGYLRVPAYDGFEPKTEKRYISNVYAHLIPIARQSACGWVIDLRGNDGGNVWPMLAALRPFLGHDPLGSSAAPDGAAAPPRKAGENVPHVRLPFRLRHLYRAPVALLTDMLTASSGEAVTISFRGRANTRSFGSPTAGLSTANDTFHLRDGGMLILTVSVMTDRYGQRYGGPVVPDQAVAGSPAGAPGSDIALATAEQWLGQACKAR